LTVDCSDAIVGCAGGGRPWIAFGVKTNDVVFGGM